MLSNYRNFPIRVYSVPSRSITPDFIGVKEDFKAVDGANNTTVVTATFGLDGKMMPTKPTIYSKNEAFVPITSAFDSDMYEQEVESLVNGRTGFYSVLEVVVFFCELKVRFDSEGNYKLERVKVYQPCGIKGNENLVITKEFNLEEGTKIYDSLVNFIFRVLAPSMVSRTQFLLKRLNF